MIPVSLSEFLSPSLSSVSTGKPISACVSPSKRVPVSAYAPVLILILSVVSAVSLVHVICACASVPVSAGESVSTRESVSVVLVKSVSPTVPPRAVVPASIVIISPWTSALVSHYRLSLRLLLLIRRLLLILLLLILSYFFSSLLSEGGGCF